MAPLPPPVLLALAWLLSGPPPTLDTVTFDEGAMGALQKKYEQNADIPLSEPLVPQAWRVQRWWVIGEGGVREVRPKAFRWSDGASDAHFQVVLDGPGKGQAAHPGVAVTQRPEHHARLRRAKQARPDGALADRVAKDLLAKIRPARPLPKGTPTLRAFQRLTRQHLRVVALRGPKGATVRVALLRAKHPKRPVAPMAFAALLDEAGGVAHWLLEPTSAHRFHDPRYVVDLNGDGVDELIFEDVYVEGGYTSVLRLRAGQPASIEHITGDAA